MGTNTGPILEDRSLTVAALLRLRHRAALLGIAALYVVMSIVGITWGLPSRSIDPYLFGDGVPWSGEKIYRLAGAAEKMSPEALRTRGADVDINPIREARGPHRADGGESQTPVLAEAEPIHLTATEEDVARIYLRYRLYTYQPDEMITMMSLAGMRPGEMRFDPRLYQYGGLWIYPVGALIKLCGIVGLIDVRNDLVFYLDHPDEFGKFYVVARAYAAAWGLIGVFVVFAITRRIVATVASQSTEPAQSTIDNQPSTTTRPVRAGLLAALLFALMPVVVCMAHEGKPHLPGAVLMLLAVYCAMRCVDGWRRFTPDRTTTNEMASDSQFTPSPIANRQSTMYWWLMCLCCGAALGVVLSSWPIFVLIPLLGWLRLRHRVRTGDRITGGAHPGQSKIDNQPSTIHDRRGLKLAARWLGQTSLGTAVAVGVYLLTNPYIVINLFINREVLQSNFGNSLAMYEIARIGQGFLRTLELTIEGATLPVVVLGVIALVFGVIRRNRAMIPLFVAAAAFFLQFVLIGAGKPAEYGRFGIFPNTALAMAAACLLTVRWTRLRGVVNAAPAIIVLVWTLVAGGTYLANIYLDCTPNATRIRIHARAIMVSDVICRMDYDPSTVQATPARHESLVLAFEPAPYNCPPFNFARMQVMLYAGELAAKEAAANSPEVVFLGPVDGNSPFNPAAWIRKPDSRPEVIIDGLRYQWPIQSVVGIWERLPLSDHPTPISWANKPFEIQRGKSSFRAPY